MAKTAASIAVVLMLADACTPRADWDPVGETMAAVRAHSPDSQLIIYDFSSTVADKPASYNTGVDQGSWMVVASCGNIASSADRSIPLGVIPKDSYSASVRVAAAEGDYSSLLAECT